MFKTIAKGAMIGAAALMLAAPASATTEVNIFGASAQYEFWTAAAPDFLADVDGAHCLGTVESAKSKGLAGVLGTGPSWSKRDAGIARGYDCQEKGETVIITYTTYASIEGVKAAKDKQDPDGCGDTSKRGVPDVDDLDSDGLSVDFTTGTVNDLVCKDIDVGASDVAAETFGSITMGNTYGPLGGTYITSIAQAEVTDGSDGYPALDNCRPIIVEFAFFIHKNTAWLTAGEQPNLTRSMAVPLFAGQVGDWSDFGLAADTVILCLRHAGSGTHATVKAAIMRGDDSLPKRQTSGTPTIWFNKGSSDLMKCIKDQGAGAIGYADADKNGEAWNAYDSDSTLYPAYRMTYMGADAGADNAQYGIYEFWSAQWLYFQFNADNGGVEDDDTYNKIKELCAWASDGDNMPLDRAAFWISQDDMQVEKADDFTYPTRK